MGHYSDIVEDTQAEYDRYIGSHPIIPFVMSGKMTQGHYISYIRETYHMVRHTPRMLALAAGRCGDERRALRDWFIEQTADENNHDLFCIKDIRNLGMDATSILSQSPLPGAWGLIAQEYYMATYGDPIGILGVASVTEGLGATTAGGMADLLGSAYGMPSESLTFLRSHSGFDKRHLEETIKAIDKFVTTPADREAVAQGRRMTIFHYAQLFTDAIENPWTAPLSQAA